MVLNRSRDFCANFAQLLRNTATGFAPPKLCLGKMSDGKLPPVLHHCRCVHRCERQKAATGGKSPATKGVILRQVRCRFLPLRFCPVFSTTISLGDGVYPQNRFPDASLHRHLSPGLNVCNCPACAGCGRGWFAVMSLAVVVVWPWTVRNRVSKTVRTVVSIRFAPRLANVVGTRRSISRSTSVGIERSSNAT